MRKVPVLILSAAAIAAAVAAIASVGRSTAAAPGPERREPVRPYGLEPFADARYASSTSCAASACHGNGAPGRAGGEQSTWAENRLAGRHDPHRRAYSVLFDATSVRIGQNLHYARPVHRAELCLKCHALDAEKWHDGEALPNRGHADGVTCESCHGPSGRWLAAHYEAGWKGLSNRDKWERFGFAPTKNAVSRALACAACHVGTADREVNHDLIAAGHPRLNFESARFHAAEHYGPHWQERRPRADSELRTWYVGQLASLRSALALLEKRANGVKNNAGKNHGETGPWPEFAEGSCYSCHRPIGQSAPRTAGSGGRATGTVPWQTWYGGTAADLPMVHRELFGPLAEPGLPDLGALRERMQRRNPDWKDVVEGAKAAREMLDACLARLQAADDAGTAPPLEPDAAIAVGRILAAGALNDGRTGLRDGDWDFLAQHYLGLRAAHRAAGGDSGPAKGWGPHLAELRSALDFPAPNAGREAFNRPPEMGLVRLDRARDALVKLHQANPEARTER